MRVFGQRHAPAASPSRKRPGTNFTGGWVGPRAGLDGCGISRPHRDSIARTPSLYRLRYSIPRKAYRPCENVSLSHCMTFLSLVAIRQVFPLKQAYETYTYCCLIPEPPPYFHTPTGPPKGYTPTPHHSRCSFCYYIFVFYFT